MELVSIESEEEQTKLIQVVPKTQYEGWWTSGSDEGHEGHWTWTATGQPVNFTRWGRKQPDGGPVQNHLMVTKSGLYWHDWEGNYGHEFFICES